MRHQDRPTRDELVQLRAIAIWVREGQPRGRDKEIWEQARREIDWEAQTLDGEPHISDRRPARLA